MREAAMSLESNGLGLDLCAQLVAEANRLEREEERAREKGDRGRTNREILSAESKGDKR